MIFDRVRQIGIVDYSFPPTEGAEGFQGRPESPLAASAEAEALRCSSDHAEGWMTAGCSDETCLYCLLFFLSERKNQRAPKRGYPSWASPLYRAPGQVGCAGAVEDCPLLGAVPAARADEV